MFTLLKITMFAQPLKRIYNIKNFTVVKLFISENSLTNKPSLSRTEEIFGTSMKLGKLSIVVYSILVQMLIRFPELSFPYWFLLTLYTH